MPRSRRSSAAFTPAMNDHISKPIDLRRCSKLRALLHGAGRVRSRRGFQRGASAPRPTSEKLEPLEGLDFAEGLLRVAGNRKLYLKLLAPVSPCSHAMRQRKSPGSSRPAIGHSGVEPRTPVKGVAANLARRRCSRRRRIGKALHVAPISAARTLRRQFSTVLTPFVDRLRAAPGRRTGGAVAPAAVASIPLSCSWWSRNGQAPHRVRRPPRRTGSRQIAVCSLRSSPPRSLRSLSGRCRATPSARHRHSWKKRAARAAFRKP